MSQNTLEIIRQILSAYRDGTKGRTPSDSMDPDELRELLAFLVKRRLLEGRCTGNGEFRYRITKRGEEFLSEFEGLKTLSVELCKSYSRDVRVHDRLRRKIRNEL